MVPQSAYIKRPGKIQMLLANWQFLSKPCNTKFSRLLQAIGFYKSINWIIYFLNIMR